MSWPSSAAANAARSYHVGSVRPRLDVGAGFVDAELTGRSQHPGAELHGRQVALADRAQAQDEPEPVRQKARLVGMDDDRRVEEGRRLDRVLVGEPGTHQAAPLVGQLGVVRYPVGDPLVVGSEDARQVPVPVGVAVTHPRQGHADLVLGQREDPSPGPQTPGTGRRVSSS